MQQLHDIRKTIQHHLQKCNAISIIEINSVGDDLAVYYRIQDASQSSLEVRNQRKRGMPTADEYEIVNARVTVPAPSDFDENKPFDSADKYAQELYDAIDSRVAPPSSATAPDMDEGRMVMLPHNNHGSDIEAYCEWVTGVAVYVTM